MINSSPSRSFLRSRFRTQALGAKLLGAAFATVFSVGQLTAQVFPADPFQLQISDGSGATAGSVLVTQRNFGTIEMACNPNMAGGWYDVVYDCDADPTIPELMPSLQAYGPLFAAFFPAGSNARSTILSEHANVTLPMRASVVNRALARALHDGTGALSESAVISSFEGIYGSNAVQQSGGFSVILQDFEGHQNPLMFVTDQGMHFEAMRQHAMWERIGSLILPNGAFNNLFDPVDESEMTPAEVEAAYRTAFFNHAIYTSLIRTGLRLRIVAIHVRGRDVGPAVEMPKELLGMPTHPPKSRLSGPAVITFTEGTVPAIEVNMFPTTVTKIVAPGATLNYRLGGFRPGMQVALQQATGGSQRTELDVSWADYGKAAFTLPLTMPLGNHQIAEVRYRIPYPNGSFDWSPWQLLSYQPLIKVQNVGGAGGPI